MDTWCRTAYINHGHQCCTMMEVAAVITVQQCFMHLSLQHFDSVGRMRASGP